MGRMRHWVNGCDSLRPTHGTSTTAETSRVRRVRESHQGDAMWYRRAVVREWEWCDSLRSAHPTFGAPYVLRVDNEK